MKALKVKLEEVNEDHHEKSVKLYTREVWPLDVNESKNLMLDEHDKEKEYLDLPEVPSDSQEQKKAEKVDLDEEIASRLTKLKFLNKTWLKNVQRNISIKSNKTDPEALKATHEVVDDSDDEKVAAEGNNSEELEIQPVLDSTAIKTDPFFSSKEDADAFNDWYYKKISESKQNLKLKQVDKALNCVPADAMMPTKQVITNPNTSMWNVDMNVVIVVLITMISWLPKFPRMRPVPVSSAASSTLTPPVSVCETTPCSVLGMKTNDVKTLQPVTTETNRTDLRPRFKIPIWLRSVCRGFKCRKLKVE